MINTVANIISTNRKEKRLSQIELAEHLNINGYQVTNKSISRWEKGINEPSIPLFIEMCRFMGITDIFEEFYGVNTNNPLSELNEEGKKKVYEYAALLIGSGLYKKIESKIIPFERVLRLYDEPVSAGRGNLLLGDHYQEITVGADAPQNADYCVKISGDSMEPRFIDGQMVFVHHQISLENGEIGIFILNGEAYIKKLQNDSNGHFLISLNKKYDPIPISANSDFKVVGKIVG